MSLTQHKHIARLLFLASIVILAGCQQNKPKSAGRGIVGAETPSDVASITVYGPKFDSSQYKKLEVLMYEQDPKQMNLTIQDAKQQSFDSEATFDDLKKDKPFWFGLVATAKDGKVIAACDYSKAVSGQDTSVPVKICGSGNSVPGGGTTTGGTTTGGTTTGGTTTGGTTTGGTTTGGTTTGGNTAGADDNSTTGNDKVGVNVGVDFSQ